VELDAPDVATSLGVEYGIRGVPTLLAFGARRGEPRFKSRVEGADVKRLGDKRWVEQWIRARVEEESQNGGGGTTGGSCQDSLEEQEIEERILWEAGHTFKLERKLPIEFPI
jgi:hypothetical protein